MRCFFALVPPKEVREGLVAAAATVRNRIPKAAVRWADAEKIHLTIHFMAAVEPDALAPALARLEEIDLPSCFELRTAGWGGFPSLQRARVLWVGLDGDLVSVQRIHAEVLEAVGVHRVQLTPHLTLARAKGRPEDLSALASLEPARLRWMPDRLQLIKSEPAPTGARYHTVWERSLA